MEKAIRLTVLFIAVVLFLYTAGCGKGTGGSASAGKTTIPECGFSMDLPSAWVTEDYAETEFYKRGDRRNCWGMAKFCPLRIAGRSFESLSEFVKCVVDEDRFEGSLAEVVSQRPLKIGEVQADAYEVIFKDTKGAYNFTIFIEMEGKETLQVYFQAAAKDYEKFNKQYPTVVDSIHLTKKKADWGKLE